MAEHTRAELKDLVERIVCACDGLMPLKGFKSHADAKAFCDLIAEATLAVGGTTLPALIAKRVCREPVPDQGQGLCTMSKGHDGPHRCSAADVDAAKAEGR